MWFSVEDVPCFTKKKSLIIQKQTLHTNNQLLLLKHGHKFKESAASCHGLFSLYKSNNGNIFILSLDLSTTTCNMCIDVCV